MMQQQQTTIAPGNPIGYAPIYGPPPLAQDAGATPPPPPGNAQGSRWVDGFLVGGLAFGLLFALTTWGVLDGLYSGADFRALQRAANAANATAQAAEQRAINAEATAQQWQQRAGQQQNTIEDVRALVCR